MSTFIDLFPSPSLDSASWTSVAVGSGAITVGSPSDGVHFSGIDDDGDSVAINSDSKLYVPAGQFFDMRIEYNDFGTDPDQNLYAFLGWRSIAKDGGSNPLYGIDILLLRDTAGNFYFQKRSIVLGATIWSTVIADPNSGSDGEFRIERNGFVYSSYYWDGTLSSPTWVKLVDITLPSSGAGFVVFGHFASDPSFPSFPVILSP